MERRPYHTERTPLYAHVIRDSRTGEQFFSRPDPQLVREVCRMLNAAHRAALVRVASGACPAWLYDPDATWPPGELPAGCRVAAARQKAG